MSVLLSWDGKSRDYIPVNVTLVQLNLIRSVVSSQWKVNFCD